MSKSLPRRALRLLLGILVVLLAVVIVVVLALQLTWSKEKIRGFVQSTVDSAIDGTLTIGALEGNLLTGTTVRDVVLRDARGNVVARVGQAEADYGLFGLLQRRFEVTELAARDVVFVTRTYEDGVTNLASLAKDEPSTGPSAEWTISLDGISIVSGSYVYHDATRSTWEAVEPLLDEATAEDIGEVARRLEVGPPPPRETDTAELPEAVGVVPPATVTGLDVAVEGAVLIRTAGGGTSIAIESLQGKLAADEWIGADNPLALDEATMFFGEATRVEGAGLKLEGHLALGALELYLGRTAEESDVEGEAAQQEAAEGAPFDRIYARVDGLKAEAELLRELLPTVDPLVPMQASGVIAGVDDDLWFEADVEPVGPGGSLSVTGALRDYASPATTAWALHARADELRPIAYVGAPIPVAYTSFEVVGEGVGFDPETMRADAALRLGPSQVEEYRIDHGYAEVRYEDGALRVEPLRLSTPYFRAAANARLDRDGEYALSLQIGSREALGEVTGRLMARQITSERARVSLTSRGELDLGASEPLGIVEQSAVDLTWELVDFQAEDVVVAESRGDLQLDLSPVDPEAGGARRLAYDVRANGRQIRLGETRLDAFSVDAEGRTTLQPPFDDPMQLLSGLTTEGRFRVAGLDAGTTTLGEAAGLVRISPRPGGAYGYSVDATVSGLSSPGATVDSLAADLEGELVPGDGDGIAGMVQRLRARGTVAGEGIDAGGQRIDAVQAGIDVKGPVRDLEGQVQVDARGVAVADWDFDSLVASLKLTGDRNFTLDVQANQPEVQPARIDAQLKGRYGADLQSYTIEGVELNTPGFDGWELGPGLSLSLDQGRYEFDDVVLQKGDQKVKVQGYFHSGRSQDLSLQIEELRVGELRQQFGLTMLPEVRGTVEGELTLRGSARRPTANFALILADLYYQGWGPFTVEAVGHYHDQRLLVEKLEAEAYGADALVATASIPLEFDLTGNAEVLWGRSFMLRGEILRLEAERGYAAFPMLRDNAAVGSLAGSFELEGELDRPRADVKLALEDGAFATKQGRETVTIGPIDAAIALTYRPPSGRSGGIDLAADLQWAEENQVTLVASSPMPLAAWLQDLVEGEEVDWGARLAEQRYVFDLDVPRFQLREVQIAPLRAADAEGLVEVHLEGEGTLGDPRAKISVDIDDFGWNRYRDVFLDLSAEVREEQVFLQRLGLEWDSDPILAASGNFPLPLDVIWGEETLEDLPVNLKLQLLPNKMSKLSAVDYAFARMKGEIAGYVMIDGTLSSPDLKGRLSLTNAEFANRKRGTLAFDLDARENRVGVETFVCVGPTKRMTATASLPLNLNVVELADGAEFMGEGPIEASLVADDLPLAGMVPARIADAFITDLGGVLNADIKVGGTMAEPRPEGFLTLEDGKFFLPKFGRGFSSAQLKALFGPEGIDVQRIYVEGENGWAGGVAQVSMSNFQPQGITATLESREFSTSGLTPLPTFITSEVVITGDLTPEVWQAKVDVEELEVVIAETSRTDVYPLELDNDVVIVRGGVEPGADVLEIADLAATTQVAQRPLAQIAVHLERDSWIRHPNAEVEIMGDLDITLSTGGAPPTIGGEIEAVRGEADVFNRRFVLERGLVSFTGAAPPNPRLQIVAAYTYSRDVAAEIGDASSGRSRALVRITGTADAPRIELSSDPSLPESDIAWILATGRPPEGLGVGEQQSATNRVASLATGVLGTLLKEQIEDISPVEFDVLRVDTSATGGTSVEVGRYLSERVFVGVGYLFGVEESDESNRTSILLEYYFAPDWNLVFEGGDRLNGELNVFWDIL